MFATALQQLSSAVVFRIKLDRMSVVVGSDLYNVSYRRYFLESNQRLDRFLAAMGMQEKFVKLVDAPSYGVSTNLSKYVVLGGRDLAKAYAITGVASDLDVAFLAMDRGERSSKVGCPRAARVSDGNDSANGRRAERTSSRRPVPNPSIIRMRATTTEVHGEPIAGVFSYDLPRLRS